MRSRNPFFEAERTLRLGPLRNQLLTTHISIQLLENSPVKMRFVTQAVAFLITAAILVSALPVDKVILRYLCPIYCSFIPTSLTFS
jgi:hypothetical protein